MIIKYEGDKITVSGAWKVLSSFGFAEKQIRQFPNVIPKSDKYLPCLQLCLLLGTV